MAKRKKERGFNAMLDEAGEMPLTYTLGTMGEKDKLEFSKLKERIEGILLKTRDGEIQPGDGIGEVIHTVLGAGWVPKHEYRDRLNEWIEASHSFVVEIDELREKLRCS